MATTKPKLISYFREDHNSNNSNNSSDDDLDRSSSLKFYIRYVPKEFSTLSNSDRLKIMAKVHHHSNHYDSSSSSSSDNDNSSEWDTRANSSPSIITNSYNSQPPSPSQSTTKIPSRKRSKLSSSTKIKSKLNTSKPRWQRQDLLVYRTLSDIPGHVAKRSELLKKVVDLDIKLSNQNQQPLVFTGKTPCNSASASITMNKEKLFIKIQKPDCRFQYLGLSFPPNDFTIALKKYRQWESQLYTKQFPIQFKSKSKPNPKTQSKSPHRFPYFHSSHLPDEDDSRPRHGGKGLKIIAKIQSHYLNPTISHSDSDSQDEEESTEPDIPTSWRDLVKVITKDDEPISVIATRLIPAHTTLGYYFGTPTTPSHFHLHKAPLLPHRYARPFQFLILDATDHLGKPYLDPAGSIYCPYHFIPSHPTLANLIFQEGPEWNQLSVVTLQPLVPGQELFVSPSPPRPL